MALDDANSIVLLHFNGDDASVSFTDESGKTWTAHGAAQLDTAKKKFGSAAGLFSTDQEYIDTPYHADFLLGNSDWTIDFWVRAGANLAFSFPQFVKIGSGAPGAANVISVEYYFGDGGANNISVYIDGVLYQAEIGTAFYAEDTWVHIEVVKVNSSDDLHIFADGVQLGATLTSNEHPTIAGGVTIGVQTDGSIDELRISNVARHTSNFTPPDSEYGTPYICISPLMSGTLSIPNREGEADLTLPMVTLDAEGLDEILGRLSLILPMALLSGEGYDSETGELNAIFPELTIDAEGFFNDIGSADLRIPIITLDVEVFVNAFGTADFTFSMFTLDAEGIEGAVGEADLAIPMLTFSASGFLSCEGEADLIIPMLLLHSESSPNTYLNLVLNLRNNALTVYSNYLFNSMCRFGSINLGATSTKIYNLNSGTRDDDKDIDWNFRLPYLNMEIKTKKHLRLAWFSYKSDGDIIVTVVQPDGTEYEYDLKGYEVTEDGVRVKFGRGIKSKYLAIDVRSKDGSTINLDTIRILMDAFKAR